MWLQLTEFLILFIPNRMCIFFLLSFTTQIGALQSLHIVGHFLNYFVFNNNVLFRDYAFV